MSIELTTRGSPEGTGQETFRPLLQDYKSPKFLYVYAGGLGDLALFPLAFGWSQRGKLHKVLGNLFDKLNHKKKKKRH